MKSTAKDFYVPRIAFFTLLLAQVFLLLPHLMAFPLVLLPMWLVCAFWRIMIYQERWTYPSSFLKFIFVVLSCITITLVQPRWMMIETAVLMLLMAFLLKLLEMRYRRDVLIVVYLSYFVIATQLILSQDMINAVYLIMSVWLVTATLIALNLGGATVNWRIPFSYSAKLLAVSIPIMFIAFIVFPRLDPLWKVPMPAGAGKTGVSGMMSPGLFSSLAQSDEVAFRVKFDGDVPPLAALYWRGLTLNTFDGKTWLPGNEIAEATTPAANTSDKIIHYHLTMEPSQQSWLFTLPGVISASPQVSFQHDGTVKSADIIDQRMAWAMAATGYLAKVQLSLVELEPYLALPDGYNPKALVFARNLRSQSISEQQYIDKVLDYFHNQSFYYSLNPPLLGKHTVDDFLFATRKGFCEHYASSFVVLMRAAGIPARVVAGYQGGDINPFEKHVTIRQLDAHAWAEVWVANEGWKQVDPTYAVAPERIEKGSQQSLQNDDGYLAKSPLSPIKFRGVAWLRNLQYRFDQVNYLWHAFVLEYGEEQQRITLLALLGTVSLKAVGLLILAGFVMVALLMALFTAWRYRPLPLSPVEKVYRQFLKKAGKKGVVKGKAEGALDFSLRLQQQYPAIALAIDSITKQYMALNYGKPVTKAEAVRLLKIFKRDVINIQIR